MRQDQFDKLQLRAEQLTDVFLEESDPATWPGAGLLVAAMDKQTRGDRYWVKKNAVATLAVVQRIVGIVQLVREKSAGGESSPGAVRDEDAELDAEVAAANAEAEKLMKELQQGSHSSKKAAFDKRVHGKS